jgi:hypothetical protein
MGTGHRRPVEHDARCRGELCELSGIAHTVDHVEVLARPELLALDHVAHIEDRGDEQPQPHGADEQLGLRTGRAELADHTLHPLILREGLLPARQLCRVPEVVLGEERVVAAALLVDPPHQPQRERADRRAEQERDGHVPVRAGPHELDVEWAEPDPARRSEMR